MLNVFQLSRVFGRQGVLLIVGGQIIDGQMVFGVLPLFVCTLGGVVVGAVMGFIMMRLANVKSLEGIKDVLAQRNTEQARLQQKVVDLDKIKADLVDLKYLFDVEKEAVSQGAIEKMRLETKLQEEQKNSDEKIKLLTDAKVQLTKDFENLANRIFEEKNQQFKKQNQYSMETTLNPLREQLDRFKKKVEDVYEKENHQRIALHSEITHLKDLNKKMSEETVNLTKALKGDNKTQGNWGEVILERVLEESGLKKGREYETQVKLEDDDGQRRYPDVIVRLPDDRDIVIDSKVSLVDYERYCSAQEKDERDSALKAHVSSLKKHIKDLSAKGYAHLDSIRTLDFVFIFIPIEAAFLTAVEHDQGIFKTAYEKNIIIVSPTTLLATLRTVESIWRYEKQNKNAEEIAKQADALHDQVVLVVDALEGVGRHLVKAQDAYDTTFNRLSKGRGNLIGQTVKLEKLGAKTKKTLAKSLVDASLESETESV